jgi:hypothetical protein
VAAAILPVNRLPRWQAGLRKLAPALKDISINQLRSMRTYAGVILLLLLEKMKMGERIGNRVRTLPQEAQGAETA